MLTLENLKSDSWTQNIKFTHGTKEFKNHGKFCDIYFKSENADIKQEQVDIFNNFDANIDTYSAEIEKYIQSILSDSEKSKSKIIRSSTLFFDVIEVYYNQPKHDMILICSKTFKQYLFFKKTISIRVEFKNNKIKSIRRKKEVNIDN